MKNELIDRYIYAATKNLPAKTRNDVADELRSIISDMLDERCGDVLPSEKDIKIVLTELGTPRELGEKYNPDSGKALISGVYYTKYMSVLKIVLISVTFGLSLAGLISAAMEQTVWYLAFAQWWDTMFSGLLGAFAFVTIIFAIFQRRSVKLGNMTDSIDSLPPIPDHNIIIKPWDPLIGIVISVIFMVVFLGFPQVISAVVMENGVYTSVPLFDLESIKNAWFVFIGLGLVGIIKECIKLVEGRYTSKVMIATLVCNLLSIALTFVWLFRVAVINPYFINAVSNAVSGDAIVVMIFTNFKYGFLAAITFALILDGVTTIVKTLKNWN